MKNSRISLAFGSLFSLLLVIVYQIEFLIYIINKGKGTTYESELSYSLMIIMLIFLAITAVFDLLSFSTWNLSPDKYKEHKWENFVALGLNVLFAVYIVSMYVLEVYEVKMFGLAGVLIIFGSLFLFVIGITVKVKKNPEDK